MHETDVLGWVQAFAAITVAFVVVNKSIPLLIKLAYEKELYDKPDGVRKVHTSYISNLGGIAIFMAFSVALLFGGLANGLVGLPYLVGALLALFFCGLKDDLIGLKPKTKLLIEFIAASAVIFGMNLSITHFGGIFGIGDIPAWLSIGITAFTLIVVINSFNLIDGIDGLAGGVSAIASVIFSVGFFIAGDITFGFLSLSMAVISMGYLLHNFHPAKIFMGDTGSLVVGFLLAVFAIRFISLNGNPAFFETFGHNSVVIPIAALSIPLYDTIRVFARRIHRGQSPFTADSDHVHHTLLKMGLGQKRTVVYLYLVTILISLIAFAGSFLNPNLNLSLIILSMVLLLPTFGLKRKSLLMFGININRLLSPNKPVDTYNHLEVKNNKKIRQGKKEQKEVIQ